MKNGNENQAKGTHLTMDKAPIKAQLLSLIIP